MGPAGPCARRHPFHLLSAGGTVTTDNAYVKGDRAQIATQLSGLIVEVPVQENEKVSRGQLLFRLDEQSYRHALTRIEAETETVRAEIRGLRAQWRTKREEIKAALSQQTYAQAEFDRQAELAEKKVASTAKLEEARMGLEVARQRISAAQEDLQRIEAALAGDPRSAPTTIRACANDGDARGGVAATPPHHHRIADRRHREQAPRSGQLRHRGRAGDGGGGRHDLWVEANFKETELTRVRAGQKVLIHVDTYPESECHGTVSSISQSTGAEFAVLPPQNASGNWVKVVQRIPVRLSVACREGDPPLRVGMSTTVEVETGHTRSLASLWAGWSKSLGLSSASATPKP